MRMMTVLLVAGFLFIGGCSGQGSNVVATIGSTKITEAELNEAAKGQLGKIEAQIYQIKRRTLEGLVQEKIIEEAAKKAGKSVDDYLASEVDSKITPPEEGEVKAIYEAQKGKMKEPFEKMKDDIVQYLTQSQRVKAQRQLFSTLEKEYPITIMFDPPRTKVGEGTIPALGPDNAPITLVEFSDYQCPFCKRARPTIWQVLDEYKDKIKYVYRDFPLSFHSLAQKAHEAARCAGDQGKYFEFNRKLFDNQHAITVDDIKKYAADMQLDVAAFNQCLDSGKHAAAVQQDIEDGVAVGVSGTPAFFINGIMLSGAQPYQAFREVIEGELKK